MDLFTKAAKLGIQTEFIDGQGHRHVTEAAALEIIVNALPVRAPHRFLDLPVGSYRLHLTDASLLSEQAPFIVAPPDAFGGDFDRTWLLAVQLYGVRSSRNWGMGDFTDLEGLIGLAAGLGASGVGLNPLHALFDDRPADCSPYSPNSRLFFNALYIDVEKLVGFSTSAFAD